jgi:hypothetical protein
MGGTLQDTPTQSEADNADVTAGNGSMGTAETIIAATSFDATEIVVGIELVPLTSADPVDVQIVLDPSGTPKVIATIHLESVNAPNGPEVLYIPYRREIPAGSEVAAQAQATGSTPTFNVAAEVAGP